VKSSHLRAAALAALLAPWPISAAPQLRYAAVVMRHGVRSPTWDAERLNQYSARPWPDWGVPPGNLTPHGRDVIKLLGSYYREWFTGQRVLSREGCRDASRVYVWADTDQRTVETGRAFAESFLPGCNLTVHSRPDGEGDPLFEGVGGADPGAAEAVRKRLGDNPQHLMTDHRIALDTLQFILTGAESAPKQLIESPAEVAVSMRDRKLELKGPFAVSSSLSEDLLLEYANHMTGADLGWGRLTRDNLFRVLELHAVYADLTRRTPELARARGSNLLAHVLASIEQAASGKKTAGALGPPGTAVLIISGHDTNLSNISGMLGLSWTLPGYQPDDTPPGGALIFSLWGDAADGSLFVKTQYTAPLVSG
jgi:4-phytase/acid phosphatase